MRFRMTAASVAVALAVTAPAVTAQMSQDKPQEKTSEMKKAPGQPDPNDRGGEFTITGCISQAPERNGQPMMFMITKVAPA